jgi:D-2-hydroxyacid dehydrogenase (NADP+)
MNSVSVLLVAALHEECKQQIAAVSPRIHLLDAAGTWKPPDKVTPDRFQDISNENLDVFLPQAEVLYGYAPPKNLGSRAPGLKWFQTMLAGVDHFLDDELRNSSIIITNVSGLHAVPVGEFALALMLMFTKQAPFCFLNKQQKTWERFIPMLLRSKTVGIVGMGSIGSEVARLCKAFDMRVLATRKTARKGDQAKHVDLIVPGEDLKTLLSESDFVVLTLPFTKETDNIIGERELRAMKPTAYLINVGRGETIDEDALVRALVEQRIAGAGLDAFTTEPLPAGHRLWDLPNVIISPHASGRIDHYDFLTTEIFCENLRRYVNGKRLLNVVNKKRGY